MSKTLAERAAVVAELDGKRTQGAIWEVDRIDCRDGYLIVTDDWPGENSKQIITGHKGWGGFIQNENGKADASFIAHAPQMAQLIADYVKEVETLNNVISHLQERQPCS